MDFWARLLGGTTAPKLPLPTRSFTHNPQARFERFERVYDVFLELCNRPRLFPEGPLLKQLTTALDRIVQLLRDEIRGPVPHLCLQFAASNQIYAVIGRAASVSGNELVVQAAVAVFAACIDSEEDGFISSRVFAKSLTRLLRRVTESQDVLVSLDIETSILELVFTIAAKIRLQPDILPAWFQSTTKPELEDVFLKEKKSFVGITQKDDFPLCYLLMDRVHHEGRIGDFARTGLLYIFEATGASADLEEWVVSSDLPTLMASGLGGLYSQLSRELSIIHPDATLPAVLAMSDYSTTHGKSTAESAFSERHQRDMATFLSSLAFWQDVLDHCKSDDVKQTLLDHFQILFLQQLLYPSLLQSSDTDGGSSVAVLTYLTAILESLEYPDLVCNMLTYLLAIRQDAPMMTPTIPVRPSMAPRSPTASRRRQSLMLLATPNDPDDAMEPAMFNLMDLAMNSVSSDNNQTVYSALKLVSTVVARQKSFALGTLLNVQRAKIDTEARTVGALEQEVASYLDLAEALYPRLDEIEVSNLCEDVHHSVEAQMSFPTIPAETTEHEQCATCNRYIISDSDPLLQALQRKLRVFLSNSVDVNLALTKTLILIASCIDLRLDPWFTRSAVHFAPARIRSPSFESWQDHLDEDESTTVAALQQAYRCPIWSDDDAPLLWTTLHALVREVDSLRETAPNLDSLLTTRKYVLQEAILEASASRPPSAAGSPRQPSALDLDSVFSGYSRELRSSALTPVRKATSNATAPQSSSLTGSSATLRPNNSESNTEPAVEVTLHPPAPETAMTTDQLMQRITFAAVSEADDHEQSGSHGGERSASLNHVMTNVVVLQQFVLELAAVLQVRAAVLGAREVSLG